MTKSGNKNPSDKRKVVKVEVLAEMMGYSTEEFMKRINEMPDPD